MPVFRVGSPKDNQLVLLILQSVPLKQKRRRGLGSAGASQASMNGNNTDLWHPCLICVLKKCYALPAAPPRSDASAK